MSSFLPVATLGVVVVVWKAKAQLVLFHLVWRANEKCLSHVVWLLVSGWKRGPLAPVVVGEGAS